VKTLDPREATLLTGLGLIAAGFFIAQLLASIVYVPLALIVPGGVLTVTALRARPEAPE
jgi:hypothetical protein